MVVQHPFCWLQCSIDVFDLPREIANQHRNWKPGTLPGQKKPFHLRRKFSEISNQKFRLNGKRPRGAYTIKQGRSLERPQEHRYPQYVMDVYLKQ